MVTKPINEFKSDDTQSEVPEPVGTGGAHANRGADQDNGQAPTTFATKAEAMAAVNAHLLNLPKKAISDFLAGLSNGKNKRPLDQDNGQHKQPKQGAVKEDLDVVFEGVELSEEIRDRTVVVFEAAVSSRVSIIEAHLEEEFETKLTEAVESIREELTEAVDKYMSDLAEAWLEENKVPVENGLKVQMAENFITSLRDLLAENSITISEEIDVVADLTDRNEALKAALVEAQDAADSLLEEVKDYQFAEVFSTVSEGLTLTQSEKLRTLVEDVDADTVEEYEGKIRTIREAYFDKKVAPLQEESLNEEGFTNADENAGTPQVRGYAAHLSRSVRNR